MLHSLGAGVIHVAGHFNIPFLRSTDKFEYFQKLRSLICDVLWFANVNIMEVCCTEIPYNMFYFVKSANAQWHGLDFGRRKRTNKRCCRILLSHNLEVRALLQRRRDVLYASVSESEAWGHSLWATLSASCGPPDSLQYSTSVIKDSREREQLSPGCNAEVQLVLLLHGTFLRTVQYVPAEQRFTFKLFVLVSGMVFYR